ncbi:hypothetical protein D3C74_280250 [compost metagenome]
MRDVERRRDDVVERRAGSDRCRDHRGEHARGLATVARLVRARQVDRLGVGAARVARVGQPDGGHVHGRAAVDDVPDAGLTGVDVPVVQARDDPLLGEEHALEEQDRRLELGDPARLADHERDQVLGHRVRVEVRAALGVDLDERLRHEGVVRDVPVALVVRRDGAGVLPVGVVRPDDARDPPAVPLLDLLRRPTFRRPAQRVADGCAGDHRHCLLVQPAHQVTPCSSFVDRGDAGPPVVVVRADGRAPARPHGSCTTS